MSLFAVLVSREADVHNAVALTASAVELRTRLAIDFVPEELAKDEVLRCFFKERKFRCKLPALEFLRENWEKARVR
jgi:hypothetical protein